MPDMKEIPVGDEQDGSQQEAVVFVMMVDFGELIDCGGIEGLNNIADDDAYDRFPGKIISDIAYRPVGVEGENVLVEVSCLLEEM